MFIVISRHGVVFYILMTKRLAFITIDRYQSKEKYTMSCGFLKDGEEDQVPDSEMEAKVAKWKLIAGLALMNVYDPDKQITEFDDLLLLADTALPCIKCVPNISCLWRSPRETFSIYKLNLVFDHEQEGADFFPFSVKTGVHNVHECQLIAANPVSSKMYLIELSQPYTEAVVLRIIIQEKILLERQILLHR